MVGKIYGMNAEQADVAMGMLMKIVAEKDKEIERAEKEEARVKEVLDFIGRVR